MSEGLPPPHPRAPLHPSSKPAFTGTKAGTWRTSKYGMINQPVLPPKAAPILLRGAVPVPVLSSGIGRYTCLLLRLVIVRSQTYKNRLILDRWINKRLGTFSKANPNVAIYVKEEKNLPRVYGMYAHGNTRQFDLHLVKNEDQVEKILYRMVDMDGRKEQRMLYAKHTVHPSIQGYWHIFQNKPYRIPTQTDMPNLKTEQELLQRRLIQPAIVDTKAGS